MLQKKNILISNIKLLSNELDSQYNDELNFRNHCYLRIAYDNVVQNKWDVILKRPFTKFASENQLKNVVAFLNLYRSDKKKLLIDNKRSLDFRKKVTESNTAFTTTLFEDF